MDKSQWYRELHFSTSMQRRYLFLFYLRSIDLTLGPIRFIKTYAVLHDITWKTLYRFIAFYNDVHSGVPTHIGLEFEFSRWFLSYIWYHCMQGNVSEVLFSDVFFLNFSNTRDVKSLLILLSWKLRNFKYFLWYLTIKSLTFIPHHSWDCT